ncbi:hypothetical protein ACVWXN_000708 [Bradyrhizobium sp. i1.4.4]
MTRGVRLYLVGSIVLVSLAGCGRGFFQAEREPWRAEAEAACLKSGAVKEGPDLVRIDPISGPGMCGAEFPLKVAAIGEASSSYGFADEELRPPGSIGNQPRWPVTQPRSNPPQSQNYPSASYPQRSNYPESAVRQPSGYGNAAGPMSLNAPGVAQQEDEIDLPPEGTDAAGAARYMNAPSYPARPAPYSQAPAQQPLPRLGPAQGNPVIAVGPVAIKPTATLACPIVSELDRWLADTVQPSAMRWFGARVVEIKQISAYSCRGMNGNSHAHISEHAFGNALDIAAFVLADGRRRHREGRLARHAGRAGVPARRAIGRVRAFHHGARAGLERLSLRSYPCGSDAPRQPPPDLPARRRLGRRGRRPRPAAQPLRRSA